VRGIDYFITFPPLLFIQGHGVLRESIVLRKFREHDFLVSLVVAKDVAGRTDHRVQHTKRSHNGTIGENLVAETKAVRSG
jgi:hypothetical protein